MTASLASTFSLCRCHAALGSARTATAEIRAASIAALAEQHQTLAIAAAVAEHGLTASSGQLITALGLNNDAMPAVESLNLFPSESGDAKTEAFVTKLNADATVGLTLKAVKLLEDARQAVAVTLEGVTENIAYLNDVASGPMQFSQLSDIAVSVTAETLLESMERDTKLIADLDGPISAEILSPELYEQGRLIVTGALEVLKAHKNIGGGVPPTTVLESLGFNDDILPAMAEQSEGLYTAIQKVCDNGGAILAGMDSTIEHVRTQDGADAMKSAMLVSTYAQVVVDALTDGVRNLSDVSALTMQ